jgi:putative transposase
LTIEQKRQAVELGHKTLPIVRQCELLGLNRSSLYYTAKGETDYNEMLMKLIDEQYVKTPFYGIDKMTQWLRLEGHRVNHKRVRRLMRQMGLEAVYPRRKRGLSIPNTQHKIYPYRVLSASVHDMNFRRWYFMRRQEYGIMEMTHEETFEIRCPGPAGSRAGAL